MTTQTVFVVVGPNCWGKGDTLRQALARAKSHWPNFSRAGHMDYNAYRASPDVEVNEVGTIQAQSLTKLKEVRYEGDKQQVTEFAK